MVDHHRATSRSRFRRARKSHLGLWTAIALALLGLAYAAVLWVAQPHPGGASLRIDTFVDLAEKGRIEDARILDVDAYVTGTYERDDGRVERYKTAYLKSEATRTQLLGILLDNRVPTTVDQQNGKRAVSLASLLLPGLILVLLFSYLIVSFRRGTGLFAVRSGARKITGEQAGVTFADVAGQDAAVAELEEVRDFLADPDRFAALGATTPKGVLLYGPPGCGKTLLAKALAGEAGASFYSISGSDFVELYQGVGAARVRDLFKEARENAPALIFIDELDSIGQARSVGGADGTRGEQEQALNQVLAEMDGFSTSEGIVLIGATNRPDRLDPALLRPGRFDRTVGLALPDEDARLAILEVQARHKRLAADVDLAAIARSAIGLTGADLASVMNDAALLAARAAKPAISQVDVRQGLQRVLSAPAEQRRLSLRRRSIATRFADDERLTFADVAGADDAVAEVAEVKQYLAEPGRYAHLGARLPRGILLSGPPGSGKTLLARAVAGEANAAFLSVSGSEFVEVLVGQGAARVRELFAEARAMAPAIVFIDEIDAIGARRGATALEGSREREQTLNQVLVELDGFDARSTVIVMAATNRPDILDAALLRPGRFDRHVAMSLPDRAGRRAILEVHARDKQLAADVDLDVVAGLTSGCSGAELANAVNEAALLAGRRGYERVPMALVEEGIDRAVMGVGSRSTIMSAEERRVVAYHEAGHAIVALALPGATAPHKVTIVPRGASLGRATLLDPHERVIRSRSLLMDEMAVLLGGRVAEGVVFGEPASGAASDLQRADDLARTMVCELGMSAALGPRVYGDGVGPDAYRRHSEASAQAIDVEIGRLIDEAFRRAESVLAGNRLALRRVAEALVQKETLDADEIAEVAGSALEPATRPGRSA